MAEQTGISWCDHTFNPWHGCVKVSPACDSCYAATLAARFGTEWGPHARRKFQREKYWNEPIRWNRRAEQAGARRRVFCASMADVFETLPKGHPDTAEMNAARERLWALIEATPWLDWLLLTKRPQSFGTYFPERWKSDNLPGNVWLGATVENEQFAWRIDHLRPWQSAVVRFVSWEPALGAVEWGEHSEGWNWLIGGGESGKAPRPTRTEWVRAARDYCQATPGKVFHWKQWGELLPQGQIAADGGCYPDDPPRSSRQLGKKAAGHLLDGEALQHFPVVPAQRLPVGAAP